MKSNQLSSFKDYAIVFTLAAIAFALVAIAAVPKWRTNFKSMFRSDGRKVLAQAEGKLLPSAGAVKVLKVMQMDQISVEVYSLDEDGSPTSLLAKIPLEDKRDASISVQGNASNLALVDLKKDGQLEIVAPTYDEQMMPHLNAFQFDSNSKSFEKVSVPDGEL